MQAALPSLNALKPPCADSSKPSYRPPLLALDRNTRSQSPALAPGLLVNQSKSSQSYIVPVEALTFPDQDSFEDWAIERLMASHPEVVIEKKRR